MKISEVVEKLLQIQREHGDICVRRVGSYYAVFDIERIEYDAYENDDLVEYVKID